MKKDKKGNYIITKEDIEKIIPQPSSREEAIEIARRVEEEYERSMQAIIEIMKRNSELFKKD